MQGGAGGPGRGRGRGLPSRMNPDEKPKSQLSAEAKEWFPPNYVAGQQDNYYSNRSNVNFYNHNPQNNYSESYNYNNYHTNHASPNYYQPGYNQGYGAQNYSVQNRITYNQQPEQYELQNSLTQLLTMLDEVTYSPGRFATLSGPLVDSFSQSLDNLQHTRPLVDAIVDQAIKEQNFRYNGARLCTMFDIVEPQSDGASVFRPCLLDRCEQEEMSVVSGAITASEHICGFAMFLAELYMQFENPEGGRIKALGESLCKILMRMLITPNNNDTKAVCQILKLSGLALDADCKLHVDEIFNGLRASETVGVQGPLVRNVINLRQSRWGSGGFAEMVDSDASTPTITTPPVIPNGVNHTRPANNEPTRNGRSGGDSMFYLPDGHDLTSEEAAFLSQHLPPSRGNAYSDDETLDSDNENWEPGMEDEQQADYLEFLRSSNQIAR